MEELERRLGYTFHDRTRLEQALTHSSYANENRRLGVECNERLEFLGDSILGFVVADWLYRIEPHMPEGQMSRVRAELVCEASLAETSAWLGVGDALLLGRGEEREGGRSRRSLQADAFEAILAAVYLDGGLEPASAMVKRFILSKLADDADARPVDYKTALQERLQRHGSRDIRYETLDEQGPDHDKRFTAVVLVDGREIGRGAGHSKKEAEQAAARQALERREP